MDTGLGPEMKSTGECLGLAESFPRRCSRPSRGRYEGPKKGGRIIVTVKDEDKDEMIGIARGFYDMGIELRHQRHLQGAQRGGHPRPLGGPRVRGPSPTFWI